MTGHCLDDEVMCIPEPLHHAYGISVGGCEFVRHAFDESHVEAPARDDVDGRKLLRDPQRVGPVSDGIAEHQEPGARGLARQDG